MKRSVFLTVSALSIVPIALVLWTSVDRAASSDRSASSNRPAAAKVAPTAGQHQESGRAEPTNTGSMGRLEVPPSPTLDEIESDHDNLAALRKLALRDPDRSLQLSEKGVEAYPESETAAERAWWQARALVELQRFSEAQALARKMVARFPDSPFAADVRKHLLSHPLGQPPREH